jgi:hypothetical protein
MRKKSKGWKPISHIQKHLYPKKCGILKLWKFKKLFKIDLEF